MLTNASRWNAEKKINGDEKGDHKGKDEGHQLGTPTGPLQLLQVIVIITNIIFLVNYIVRNLLSFMIWRNYGLILGCRSESILNQKIVEGPAFSAMKEVRRQLNNLIPDGAIIEKQFWIYLHSKLIY